MTHQQVVTGTPGHIGQLDMTKDEFTLDVKPCRSEGWQFSRVVANVTFAQNTQTYQKQFFLSEDKQQHEKFATDSI